MPVRLITGAQDLPLMGKRPRRRRGRGWKSARAGKVTRFLAGEDTVDDEKSGLDPDRKTLGTPLILRPERCAMGEGWFHKEGKLWCVGLIAGQGFGEGDQMRVAMKGGHIKVVILDRRVRVLGDMELWSTRL